jgi:signal recognition particle subunit SRP54
MTPSEREDPSIIDGGRRKRLAAGSGRTIQEVNNLMKQFSDMKKMMKQMNNMGGAKKALGALDPKKMGRR